MRANPSLGAAEVALLREVNRLLGDSLPTDVRHRLVKREYAEGELAARDSAPARTPDSAAGLLEDLEPVVAGPDDPPPDVPPPADLDPERVVRALRDRAGSEGQGRGRRTRWWRRT